MNVQFASLSGVRIICVFASLAPFPILSPNARDGYRNHAAQRCGTVLLPRDRDQNGRPGNATNISGIDETCIR